MGFNDSLNTTENKNILFSKVIDNYKKQNLKFANKEKSVFLDSLFSTSNIKLALKEQELYNIPASVTLAQLYVESKESRRYRMSVLATEANNYFGIKFHKNSLIKESYAVYTEEEFSVVELKRVKRRYVRLYKVKGKIRIRLIQDFAKFENAEDAFRVHSLVIDRYNITGSNYKDWTYGLVKNRYATAWHYAVLLNTIIERYNLNELDHLRS
jgi:flagellum-specific peptidoglycan hydrolase FlgJ